MEAFPAKIPTSIALMRGAGEGAYHRRPVCWGDACVRLIAIASIILVAGLAPALAAPPSRELQTEAERTNYRATGRYDEVERLCARFQEAWPSQVVCHAFGRSAEGRPLLSLVVSGDGVFDPVRVRASGRTVVFLQGGIHPGEIDGKDAGFRYLRDLLMSKVSRGALEQVTIVFVPVFNVDGHERRGRWNRPNQNGPEETGWRVTAQNLNLNRDYMKADAPEMQAMLALLAAWDPIVYGDLHVTDGADFEHDISITIEPLLGHDPDMAAAGQVLQADILAHLSKHGSLPLSFYPSFVREDDPQSGFAVDVPPPRFSNGYWALRNRFGVLVETHSWKPYAVRERGTYRTIESLVDLAARDGAKWREVAARADERAAALSGQRVPLAYASDEHVTMIDFRGYAYSRSPSRISGGLVTRYDPARRETWRIPLRDRVRVSTAATAPRAGYIVPAGHADWMSAHLARHGIQFQRLAKAHVDVPVEAFRAADVQWSAESFEGRVMVSVRGDWQTEPLAVPAGSLWVPIAQAKARLVMSLLEPTAPDSYVSWGFFNSAFEKREYMEAYVAEQIAEEMLAKDSAVRAEFERRLADDSAFRASAEARLEFFYKRHDAWDERYRLYPVLRADHALE
jgi:murein tripeptide amidase MpaA